MLEAGKTTLCVNENHNCSTINYVNTIHCITSIPSSMTHVEYTVFTVLAPSDLLLQVTTLPLAVLSCDCSVNTFTGIIPRVEAPHVVH